MIGGHQSEKFKKEPILKTNGLFVLTLTKFTNHESRVTPACRNDALRRAGTIHGDRGTSEQLKGEVDEILERGKSDRIQSR
jgi:hypothetical protein